MPRLNDMGGDRVKRNTGVDRAIFLGFTLDLCFVILLLSVLHCDGLMGFQTLFFKVAKHCLGEKG